jgi:hypothetical protein
LQLKKEGDYRRTNKVAPLTSTFFLATLPSEQQALFEAVVAEQSDLAAQQEDFAAVEAAGLAACSPACNEVIVAKAASVRQTRSFFIDRLTSDELLYNRP